MGIVLSVLAYLLSNKKPLQSITNMKQLTPEQITLIKKSWVIPSSQPIDSGEAILIEFFTKFPHNQQKFKAFKDEPLAKLKGSASFRSHAGRIMEVFTDTVDALGTEDVSRKLEEIWLKIGDSHAQRKIPRDSFNELQTAIVDILCAACNLNNAEKEAWGILLENIYQIIFTRVVN